MRRRFGLCLRFALPGAAALLPSFARATDPNQQACITAYERAQEYRQQEHLVEARQQLLVCARDPCSPVLQRDCAEWLTDVEQRMPSIVVVARALQRSVTNAKLWVDGALAAERLDGRALDINPGEHEFRVESSGVPPLVRRVVIYEGDKARQLAFDLAAPSSPPSPSAERPSQAAVSRPTPWTVYALAGFGAIALGTFAGFGIHGVSDRAALDSCKGSCLPSAVDSVRQQFVVADISLAAAALSLGAGALLWFARPSVQSGSTSPSSSGSLSIELGPGGIAVHKTF